MVHLKIDKNGKLVILKKKHTPFTLHEFSVHAQCTYRARYKIMSGEKNPQKLSGKKMPQKIPIKNSGKKIMEKKIWKKKFIKTFQKLISKQKISTKKMFQNKFP